MEYTDVPDAMHQHFPAHGWATGVTGIRSIRLPVLRLLRDGHPSFEHLRSLGLNGMQLQMKSPERTLRQIGIGLRDLHRELRSVTPFLDDDYVDALPSADRNRVATEKHEKLGRVELLLIAIFVLLRRLGDELMDATRPILFDHWQSAPQQMKRAIQQARTGGFGGLRPRCETSILVHALLNQTAWFAHLREEDGIRDILVHRDHILQVGAEGRRAPGAGRTDWRVSAHLLRWKAGRLDIVDLMKALAGCMQGACEFMTSLYRCLDPFGRYCVNDVLFLTGKDNDIVGFWPSVGGERHPLPLMS